MLKNFGRIILIATILISIVGCTQPSTMTSTVENKQLTTVRLSECIRFVGYMPTYIGITQGYFQEEGLNVELSTAGGDSQAFSSVIGGSADIAIADPMMSAISKDKGGPGIDIGLIINKIPFVGVAKKDTITEITDPSQFKGLTIVTYPKPMTNYTMILKTLKNAGLKEGVDTIVIQAAPGSELGPIEVGKADIAMTLEPQISNAILTNGYHAVYHYAKVWGEFAFTGILTTEEYIKNNPDTVQKFMNGIQKSLNFLNDPANTARAVEIAMKWFPDVDKKVLESAINNMRGEEVWPSSAVITEEAWSKHLNIRVELGDISKTIPLSDGSNNSFAQTAFDKFGKK